MNSVLDLESDGELIRQEVAKLSPMQRQVVEMHYHIAAFYRYATGHSESCGSPAPCGGCGLK